MVNQLIQHRHNPVYAEQSGVRLVVQTHDQIYILRGVAAGAACDVRTVCLHLDVVYPAAFKAGLELRYQRIHTRLDISGKACLPQVIMSAYLIVQSSEKLLAL